MPASGFIIGQRPAFSKFDVARRYAERPYLLIGAVVACMEKLTAQNTSLRSQKHQHKKSRENIPAAFFMFIISNHYSAYVAPTRTLKRWPG